MKSDIKRDLAALLVLFLIGLLMLGYFSFQKGQQNQTQNANTTGQNQTHNGNITLKRNDTQNGSATNGQPGQAQNGSATPGQQNHTQNGGFTTGNDQGQNGVVSIANPASVYCVQNGGVSTIVTAADGNQSRVCVFANGTRCEEWAYYRGECPPVNQPPSCSDSSCRVCNQTACIAQSSCQWDSALNACRTKPPSCSDSSCGACANQAECIAQSSCQWDSASSTCRTKPPSCSGSSCRVCNQTACIAQSSCQWDSASSTCRVKSPPMNITGLVESDFMVVDDSMPNLLTSQKPFELPPPPENNAAPPQ